MLDTFIVFYGTRAKLTQLNQQNVYTYHFHSLRHSPRHTKCNTCQRQMRRFSSSQSISFRLSPHLYGQHVFCSAFQYAIKVVTTPWWFNKCWNSMLCDNKLYSKMILNCALRLFLLCVVAVVATLFLLFVFIFTHGLPLLDLCSFFRPEFCFRFNFLCGLFCWYCCQSIESTK